MGAKLQIAKIVFKYLLQVGAHAGIQVGGQFASDKYWDYSASKKAEHSRKKKKKKKK